MVLPLDILLMVLEYYADQTSLYRLGLTCRCVSPHALQQLWSMPYISTVKSLNQLTATLALSEPLYSYQDWMTGLAVHLHTQDEARCAYQTISSPLIFSSLLSTRLEILSLQKIHITEKCALSFGEFFTAQLDGGMSELHLYDCTPMTVGYILTSIEAQERPYLRRLYLHDCYLTDFQIERLAVRRACSYLQTLVLNRCGCFSDTAMLAIARHCRQLITLVVTLPPTFIQSNTITLKSIEALEKYCLSLRQFICGGQIRITEYTQSSTNKRHQLHFHVTDTSLLLLS